jgi:predicted RND superfamily exporter protein
VLGVAYNGLTTMAGFGSLLLAHHQGVWGLGLLLVIGTAVTLTASLVVLPVLLRLSVARSSATVTADEPIVVPALPHAS